LTQSRSRLDQIDGGICVLTLNDPAKRNAIDTALAAELVERAHALATDDGVRALVVTGAGTAFCAGADLPEVFGEERSSAEAAERLRAYYECFLAIRRLPFPTFAAVNGPAIGAGLNLALSCDIRVAAPSARFGATFTRIGLHPGGGCSSFLVEAIGRQRALLLLLEGGVLNAEEAVSSGLAAVLADDALAAALELAQAAAGLEPKLARDVVRAVEIAATEGFDAVLEFETAAQAASTRNPRFREHVARFAGQ
jgi:enoyl-CoA hydratase